MYDLLKGAGFFLFDQWNYLSSIFGEGVWENKVTLQGNQVF